MPKHPFFFVAARALESLWEEKESLRAPFMSVSSKVNLPLVSREWRNGVQLELLLLPFLHSLLTKGRLKHMKSPL